MENSYYNPIQCDLFAKLREEKVKGNSKFALLLRGISNDLIIPSLDESFEEKETNKKLRKQLNNFLKQKAILLLKDKNFIDDLLLLAEKFILKNTIYNTYELDFYEKRTSPSINAFFARLRYRTFLRISQKMDERPLFLEDIFDKEISLFLKKYNLDFYWTESITHLLISGIWYLPRHTTVIHVNFYNENNERLLDPRIFIEISIDTSIAEISLRKEELVKIKKEVYSNNKKRNTVIRDHDIEDLIESESLIYQKNIKKDVKELLRIKNKMKNNKDKKNIPPQAKQEMEILKRPLKSIYFF